MAETSKKRGLAEIIADWTDWFPFGTAPLILLVLFLLTGIYQLANPLRKEKPTLLMWTFATSHHNTYTDLIPSFERRHPGKTVDVQLVQSTAIGPRLRAAFWTDLEVPDLVEIEITRAGSFFRGPPEQIGFIDLTPFLERPDPADGVPWMDKIVASRLAPYTVIKNGKKYIFGLPHDVHPVMLAYRADILEPELRALAARNPRFAKYKNAGTGKAPLDIPTWDEFAAIGRELTGETENGRRYMCEMSDTGRNPFEVLMFQNDGGYFNQQGEVTFDNEKAVEVMLKYIPMVAGPNKIGKDLGWGAWAKAVEDGTYICWFTPDWRSKFAENRMPSVAGKLKLAPLPAFKPGGRRTSTWGGTMIGITRRCQARGRAELAWKLALHLYLNEETLELRFHNNNILPPFKPQWKHPVMDAPNAFYSGQPLGRLYADLGADVPPQYASPFIEMAKAQVATAVSRCAKWYNANHKKDSKAFENFVRQTLKELADAVRKETKRNPF